MTHPEFRFGAALLFCPADRPDRYVKALDRSDAVILDLEDAVSDGDKTRARDAVVATPLDPERTIVRVNPASSEHHAADLAALAETAYRTVLLPKAESTADLIGLVDYEVLVLCETARGVLAAAEIATCSIVSALMWGAEDLVASLGGSSSRDEHSRYRDFARHARSQVLLAAAANGMAAIDTVHLDIADHDGLRDEATDAAAIGFSATACIHPSQVDVVREAYRPSAERVEWAYSVLELAKRSAGVFEYRGQMIDAPVVRQAEAAVRRAGCVR